MPLDTLDIIELIILAEKDFESSIEEPDESSFVTVGDFCRYLTDQISANSFSEQHYSYSQIFDWMVSQFGFTDVGGEQITDNTRLEDIERNVGFREDNEMQQLVGQIQLFPYQYPPEGWTFCEGQLLLISRYAALFSLIGTTYGGDGLRTFALPDLKGKEPNPDMHYCIALTGTCPRLV